MEYLQRCSSKEYWYVRCVSALQTQQWSCVSLFSNLYVASPSKLTFPKMSLVCSTRRDNNDDHFSSVCKEGCVTTKIVVAL